MKPDLGSERARREWAWLVARVGEERALAAVEAAVARGRRPFVVNAASELGLRVPPVEELPLLPEQAEERRRRAKAAIEAAKRLLGG